MNKLIIGITGFLISTLWCGPAAAWASANRYGGSTEHVAGVGTEHTSAYGTSTAHAYGGGTEHTNVYGGTTAGKYGEGAYHTGPYGATAYHPPTYGGAYYHPPAPYYPYHPPVAVPYYSSGCTGCAAAAGAVVGVAAGAAIASANTAAATSSAYSAGVAAGSANTEKTESAYNAGVAAGAASATYAMGANYAALPPGAMAINRGGTTYYLKWQHLVPAGVRRERRLLPGGAGALMQLAEAPLAKPVSGTYKRSLSSALMGTALLVGCAGDGPLQATPLPEPLQIEAGSRFTLRVPLMFSQGTEHPLLPGQSARESPPESRVNFHTASSRRRERGCAAGHRARHLRGAERRLRRKAECFNQASWLNVTRIELAANPTQPYTLSCQWPPGRPRRERFLTSEEIQGAIGAHFSMALQR